MIWQEGIEYIVMLTNLIEGPKVCLQRRFENALFLYSFTFHHLCIDFNDRSFFLINRDFYVLKTFCLFVMCCVMLKHSMSIPQP